MVQTTQNFELFDKKPGFKKKQKQKEKQKTKQKNKKTKKNIFDKALAPFLKMFLQLKHFLMLNY